MSDCLALTADANSVPLIATTEGKELAPWSPASGVSPLALHSRNLLWLTSESLKRNLLFFPISYSLLLYSNIL